MATRLDLQRPRLLQLKKFAIHSVVEEDITTRHFT